MKFGKQLEVSELPKFRGNYIQYKELKKALKVYTGQEKDNATVEEVTHWTSSFLRLGPNPAIGPEARLNEVLKRELDRISRVVELEQAAINTNLNALLQDARRGGDLASIASRMEALGDDIVNLKSFSQMNFTGFRKILKKYDKWSQKSTMAWYMGQVVKAPLMTVNYDELLMTLNAVAITLKSKGGKPTEVVRQRTASQEIRPEGSSRELVMLVDVKDTMKVRVQLAINMQMQSAAAPTAGKTSRAKTVSVFYDTPQLDCYSARILGAPAEEEKATGTPASSIELRRSDASQLVAVLYQGKGEDSCTEFLVSKADAARLLQGQANSLSYQSFQNASAPGAVAVLGAVQPAGTAVALQKAQEAQLLLAEGFRPMAQASYVRNITMDDSGVTAILDEDMRMAKSKDWEHAAGASDYFPYNVLTITYPVGVSTTTPRWLRTICDNVNLLQVAGFTKSAHAIARFHGLGNGLPVPHWYHNVVNTGNVEEDNDAPPSHEPSEVSSGKAGASDVAEESKGRGWTASSARLLHEFGTTPQFEDEMNAKRKALARSTSADPDHGLPGAAPASAGNDLGAPLLARDAPQVPEPTFFQRLFGADPKTTLDKPVRRAIVAVQPKTLYSNERTFLEWIHFATITAAAGVLMLHATGETAHVMIGRLLILAAIFQIVWSMHVFNWRADGLDFKVDMAYQDNVGPVVLVFSVLAALGFSSMHAAGMIA